MSDLVEFHTKTDPGARHAFQTWYEQHPSGLYLNVSGSKCMLHHVGCFHLGRPADWTAEEGDPTTSLKVCAEERAELERWAAGAGRTLTICSGC